MPCSCLTRSRRCCRGTLSPRRAQSYAVWWHSGRRSPSTRATAGHGTASSRSTPTRRRGRGLDPPRSPCCASSERCPPSSRAAAGGGHSCFRPRCSLASTRAAAGRATLRTSTATRARWASSGRSLSCSTSTSTGTPTGMAAASASTRPTARPARPSTWRRSADGSSSSSRASSCTRCSLATARTGSRSRSGASTSERERREAAVKVRGASKRRPNLGSEGSFVSCGCA
mmetsp:Transcript_22176/g.67534  ORF Transcript_22176/g.67534 Transcript_22176/m.67534 type:complete len:229 (-) Transcript_22176:26-712(-)